MPKTNKAPRKNPAPPHGYVCSPQGRTGKLLIGRALEAADKLTQESLQFGQWRWI